MQNQPTSRNQFLTNLRILWAITKNDMVAALKNKNIVSNILLALAVAIFYRYMPEIFDSSEPQNLLVYDAGESMLVPLLEDSKEVIAYTYDSVESMQEDLSNSDRPELGLIIPAGFDQALQAGTPLPMQGSVMNWLNAEQAAEQKQLAEAEIARLVGSPVAVELEGNLVYPSPDSHGLLVTASFGLIYIILMTALPMIPHLFLEERQARTLDALLVSPASAAHIVGGKALAGLIFSLLGAVVGLFVFWFAFVHWWLTIPIILLGVLFTVAVALLLGMRSENRGQMSMGMWILILPLLVPVFLSIMEPLIPAVLAQVFRFVPTTALFNLFRISMSGEIPWGTMLLWFAWVAAWVIGLLALVIVQVRRLDRPQERAVRPHGSGIRQAFEDGLSGPSAVNHAGSEPALPQTTAAFSKALAVVSAPAQAEASPSGWKIILAIVAKDVREAIQNKVFLSILMGTVLLAFFNTALPLLVRGRGEPTFAVYDAGGSTILRELAGADDLRMGIYDTPAEMEELVNDTFGMTLGLVIPADFDAKLGSAQPVVLQGYISHTANPQKMAQWAALFESALQKAAQLPASSVQIRFEENVLYPSVDDYGQSSMIAIVLGIVVFTIGAALVPLLFIEEKEAHTLDALLVSPARMPQVVVGKALVGGIYCLLCGVIIGLFNLSVFVHLETALLAVLLTAFFAVSVGLLLGVLTQNPTNAGMSGSLFLLVLVALTVLGLVKVAWMPPLVSEALSWLPGPAVLNLFRVSMAGEAPVGMILSNAGALLAASLLLYGLVVWRVSRVDR